MYQPGQPTGYVTTTGMPQVGAPVITQTTVTTNNSSGMRDAIPALPMALAVILCIVNIFLPGIGTILAGFSVLCCGNVGQSGGGRIGTFCINFWVGLLQLLLVVFVVGWVWSIIWGVAFIAISADADSSNVTTTTTMMPAPVPAYGYAQPQPPATVVNISSAGM